MRADHFLVILLFLVPARSWPAEKTVPASTPLRSTAFLFNGSGFLIDRENRLLVTCQHVVQDQEQIPLVFPMYAKDDIIADRSYYRTKAPAVHGKVVWSDRKRDLALVQLEFVPEGVPALPLARARPQAGGALQIIGHPRGSVFATTAAALHDIDRGVEFIDGQKVETLTLLLKLDPKELAGNSGGPVVNRDGELVGLLTGQTRGNDIAFVIDAEVLRQAMQRAKPKLTPFQPSTERVAEYRQGASAAIGAGDYSRAIVFCNYALALNSRDALSYNERGVAWSYLERYAEAIQDYSQAIALDARLTRAWRNRGSAYFYQAMYPQAVADCTKALEIDPNYSRAYLTRAQAYEKLGDSARAKADRAQAQRLETKKK